MEHLTEIPFHNRRLKKLVTDFTDFHGTIKCTSMGDKNPLNSFAVRLCKPRLTGKANHCLLEYSPPVLAIAAAKLLNPWALHTDNNALNCIIRENLCNLWQKDTRLLLVFTNNININ